MARAPFQVLVIPFRRRARDRYVFGVLRRTDDSSWQGVAGGGEQGERPAEAAVREAEEELGLARRCQVFKLSTIASVPAECFSACTEWPADTYVVPEYAFAVDCTGARVRLSLEHDQMRWVAARTARRLLRWDSNRTAVWELERRLERRDLHEV